MARLRIVDPERLLKVLNIKLGKRLGTEQKVACPYAANKHQSGKDTDPSCIVSLSKQVFHCKACGSKGTLIKLAAQQVFGRDDEAAVLGIHRQYKELVEAFSSKVCDPNRVEQWHQALVSDDMGLLVIAEKKGITEDTVREYRLGLKGEKYTIPMKNSQGDFVLVKLYNTDPNVSSQNKFRKMKGFTAELIYPAEALDKDTVVIAEGEIKALLLRQMGFNACACTTGSKGWKSEWNALFKDKRVFVIYDNDTAGRAGSLDVARSLYRYAKSIAIVTLPEMGEGHNDITDWIVAEGHTKDELVELFKSAEIWSPESAGSLSPSPQMELNDVGRLSEIKDSKHINTHVRVNALIAAEDEEPYVIPNKWAVGCLRDQGKTCSLCPVHQMEETTFELPSWRVETLRFVDAPEWKRDKEMDRLAGIPSACGEAHSNNVTEWGTLRAVELLPDVEHVEDTESVDSIPAYIADVPKGTEINSLHSLIGFPTPHPHNGRLVLHVYGSESHSDSLDTFQLSDEQVEACKQFQPDEWTKEAVEARLDQLYDDMRQVTHIIGRRDLHMGVDLVYHSVLSFDFNGKKTNGWVDAVVVGDTATGKSETTERLREFYSLGDRAVSSTSSFAGLIGSTQESVKRRRWVTRWGKVPLNDRRLVIVEECGLLNPEIYQFMRDIRSSGRIIIDKAKRNAALARTRLLWIGNPRNNRPIDQFSHGILSLRSIVPGEPDIRRFDFCVVTANDEVAKSDLEAYWLKAKGKQTLDPAPFRALLAFAWSRKTEDVTFNRSAVKACIRAATALSRRFSSRLPLVETSMYEKLARLSAALAVRTFSSDGVKVTVRSCHVDAVVAFLERVYSTQAADYAGWSRLEFEKDHIEDEDTVKNLLTGRDAPSSAATITHTRTLVEFLLDNEFVTISSFGMAANLSRIDAEKYIGELLRHKAVKSFPRIMDGYVKTPGFTRILRNLLGAAEDKTPEEAYEHEEF
jgi:hypothetical protein